MLKLRLNIEFRVYFKILIAISQVYTIYTTKYIIVHIQYNYQYTSNKYVNWLVIKLFYIS